MRGNCTKENCKYPHVRVNPAAPVCNAFARVGWCAKGTGCNHRHAKECPAYSNHGECHDDKCHLPHIDRAVTMRMRQASVDPAAPEVQGKVKGDEEMTDAGASDDGDAVAVGDGREVDRAREMEDQDDFIRL